MLNTIAYYQTEDGAIHGHLERHGEKSLGPETGKMGTKIGDYELLDFRQVTAPL